MFDFFHPKNIGERFGFAILLIFARCFDGLKSPLRGSNLKFTSLSNIIIILWKVHLGCIPSKIQYKYQELPDFKGVTFYQTIIFGIYVCFRGCDQLLQDFFSTNRSTTLISWLYLMAT